MSTRAGPRPAPTIILLRDLSGGPEAFMLQRTRSAAFLPGAYVFPGGALDATDHDARAARRPGRPGRGARRVGNGAQLLDRAPRSARAPRTRRNRGHFSAPHLACGSGAL